MELPAEPATVIVCPAANPSAIQLPPSVRLMVPAVLLPMVIVSGAPADASVRMVLTGDSAMVPALTAVMV